MSASFPDKDPNEVLDYTFDWSKYLRTGETIASANISVAPAGLSLDPAVTEGAKVRFVARGGTIGATYTVTCEVMTSANLVANRSATLTVADL